MYLFVTSSAGLGLTLLREMCVCLLNCKVFGGSRVNPTWGDACCLLNCKVFGGSRVNPTREMCVVYVFVRSSAGKRVNPSWGYLWEMCVV